MAEAENSAGDETASDDVSGHERRGAVDGKLSGRLHRWGDYVLGELYERYLAEYHLTPNQVDDLDYWFVTEAFPRAKEKRLARERFDDAQHQMQIRGPEGHSVMRDEHKQVVRGNYTVEYDGFNEYMQELALAGGFTIETGKGKTEGKFIGGLAAINLLARVTGGQEISENEVAEAQARAKTAGAATNRTGVATV